MNRALLDTLLDLGYMDDKNLNLLAERLVKDFPFAAVKLSEKIRFLIQDAEVAE